MHGSLRRSSRRLSCGIRYHTEQKLESNYEKTDQIAGAGSFATVKLVKGKKRTAVEDKTFVLKTQAIRIGTRSKLRNEVGFLLTLDHPNVVRVQDAYETYWNLHIVMEYCSGKDLHQALQERKFFPEEDASKACRQILKAVNYLHSQEIVHHDLKPENFVYVDKTQDQLKLIDFGTATRKSVPAFKRFEGTVVYAAPEVHQCNGQCPGYDEKVDNWSIGVTAFTLVTGRHMFKEQRMGNWNMQIEEACDTAAFKKVSDDAQDFVLKLVEICPRTRSTLYASLEHLWIKRHHRARGCHASMDLTVVKSARSVMNFSRTSRFRKACLFLMAWAVDASDCECLRQVFERLDVEESGTISLKNFKETLQSMFDISTETVQAMFEELTEQGGASDEVSYREFVAAAMQDRVNEHEQTVHEAFARLDQDTKGYLTVEDFEAVLGEKWHGATASQIFSEADPDATGRISHEAFVEYMIQPVKRGSSNEMVLKPDKVDGLWQLVKKQGAAYPSRPERRTDAPRRFIKSYDVGLVAHKASQRTSSWDLLSKCSTPNPPCMTCNAAFA